MRLALCLIAMLALCSCEKSVPSDAESVPSDTDRRADARAEETVRHVRAISARRNGVVDWEKRLPTDEAPVFTVLIEDIFRDPNNRPYLFFIRIADIKRTKRGYLLLANIEHVVYSRRTIFFHLRLTCSDQTVSTVLQSHMGAGICAVFATVHSVEKPDLFLFPDFQSEGLCDKELLAATYPEDIPDYFDVVLTGPGASGRAMENLFFIRGECLDIVAVASDPWWGEQSEYERFRKLFDSEVNGPQ